MAGLRFQPAARAAGIEHMTAHSARVGFASVLTSRCGSTTDVIARRELEDEPDGGTLLGRGDPRARGRGVAPLKQALAGTMEVRAPRVSDRRVDEGERHEVHESDPAVPRRIVGARVAREGLVMPRMSGPGRPPRRRISMTSRWCLAAALMLSPALSLALVVTHTVGLRQRLVEQGRAPARLEERNRTLHRRLMNRAEAHAELEEHNWRLRLVDQDNTGLRQRLVEQGRAQARLEEHNRALRQRLVEQAQARFDEAVTKPLEELERRLRQVEQDNKGMLQRLVEQGEVQPGPEQDNDWTLRTASTAAARAAAGDARREADRLRDEKTALEELDTIQRTAGTWISTLAVAGLLGFIASPALYVNRGRDHLKSRLKQLRLEVNGLKHAAAERDELKHRVTRLENEAAEFAKTAQEHDQLKTRLQEADAERDDLKRRVRRLKKEVAGFANTARERDQLKTRLQEADAERDDLKRRVRRLRNTARERDQLKTRLQEADAARDDLRRRVRHLENEAAGFANRRADPDRYDAGLALLGLRPPVTPETARTAYHKVSRTIHPDVCKGPEATRLMRLATECYERIAKA